MTNSSCTGLDIHIHFEIDSTSNSTISRNQFKCLVFESSLFMHSMICKCVFREWLPRLLKTKNGLNVIYLEKEQCQEKFI